MAAAEAAGSAPDYEAAELYTRAFRVGALGRCWRQQLGPPDLSLAAEAAAEAEDESEAAVAAELGCAAETAAELRAVCRWRRGRRAGLGGEGGRRGRSRADQAKEGPEPPGFSRRGFAAAVLAGSFRRWYRGGGLGPGIGGAVGQAVPSGVGGRCPGKPHF